ncbi:unnamed protein product [Euphydryas editha]|uniref:Uncharacterized protein n=1 Tax=Euphydryas editha TaxID=104508 RepID=A0AAU9V0X1_EUPED|nr:unnamed protein product [Euphydryas editha]
MDILGLCEVQREGEDTKIFKSGYLFYYRDGDQHSQGFMVHGSLIDNIITIRSVLRRVVYLMLKISEIYSLKVIRVYAPKLASS